MQVRQRPQVDVALGMQAAHRGPRGQAQPAELGRIVLHIDGVALVAALGEAVGERDRLALGAAVHQRAGDECEPHAPRLKLAGAYTSAMTMKPMPRRTRSALSPKSACTASQAAAAASALQTR